MRIGVYGGTFDPIHNGHLEIARAVTENFRLDRLLIVPSARPPHKNTPASHPFDRYAMAVLATDGLTDLFVSPIELEAPDEPYTFQTIGKIRLAFGPESSLFFLMGSDSFEDLPQWKKPELIIAESNMIVACRPGHDIKTGSHASFARTIDLRGQTQGPESDSALASRSLYLTDYVVSEVSSTDIRKLVRMGESISGLVPSSVANHIQKYGLYQTAP